MAVRDYFNKRFIPAPAYFTFWSPKTKRIVQRPHRHGVITDEEIDLHLNGKQGLTVSPFIDEENVLFGVIDVDVQDFELVTKICTRLQQLGVAPNIFESKQKGYHLYILPERAVSAVQMRQAINSVVTDDIAVRDGKSVIDIFPAQDRNTGKGGNKVNLPLLGASRRQLSEDGQVMEGFSASLTPSECFDKFQEVPAEEEMHQEYEPHAEINGSYPCINNILQGVKKGCRNAMAFELGRYWLCRGVPREKMQDTLLEWDKKNDPPLKEHEIKNIIHSLREDRSNSAPNCDNQKLKPFCDPTRCNKAEITICFDPKVLRKQKSYHVEEYTKNGSTQTTRASNFTFDVVGGDRELKVVELIVNYKDRHERIRLQNPTWSKFLTECSLRGLACDHYGKIKLSVLIAAEVSRNPSVIDDATDVDAMDFEKLMVMIREEIKYRRISFVEEDIPLLKEEIVSGWIDNGILYLKTGEICKRNHINSREMAQILKNNGAKPKKGVRAPIAGHPSLKVWVLDWPEEEVANATDEAHGEDGDE